MRLPRIRIRTMMVGVLLTALLTAGGMEARRLSRLTNYYRARGRDADNQYKLTRSAADDAASAHEECVEQVRISDASIKRVIDFAHTQERPFLEAMLESNKRSVQSTRQAAEQMARHADHYRRLKQKYEAAARYPWRPIEPDPPPPD